MGYARYIGRVGALAVTLGVGVALASPGVAFAEPTDGPSPTSGETTSQKSTSEETENTPEPESPEPAEVEPAEEPAEEEPAEEEQIEEEPTEEEPVGELEEPTDELDGDEHEGQDGDPDELTDLGDEGNEPAVVDDKTPSTDTTPTYAESTKKDPAAQQGPETVHLRTFDVDATVIAAEEPQLQTFSLDIDQPVALITPTTPTPLQTLVGVVRELVATVFQPLLSPGGGSPLQLPILTAVLALVRNEFEKILTPRKTTVASQQNVAELVEPAAVPSVVDPDTARVLVIGVDGTNLSRILADPDNVHFAELMADSTTAPSSIVGHTTISNPSWTAILTGVWGERTGVINNVFTPWTYEKYPTVFNQLEALPTDVDTTVIGDWDVINAIAAAGDDPADVNLYVAQLPGDTDWLATDDKVADLTIDAINNAEEGQPAFIFSYYVGVDENGHMYGGDSLEYELAIENMDENLGEIMAAVDAWNATHPPEEQWTVIVVTDHGHQPQQGVGHGFQSPDETETFVIANGPDFNDGDMNLEYEIVDTTPTVVTLFGGVPRSDSDGVSLLDLGAGNVHPTELKQALQDAIATHGYPDIVTNVALGLRTVFATIPYFVYTTGIDAEAAVPTFLVVPVQILFDGLYVVTNVPAQIVAYATGVSGASIFPLLPPEPPNFTPVPEDNTLDSRSAIVA